MGNHLIGLSQIASLLNDHFGLKGKREIGARTPKMWWYRSQRGELESRMPEPIQRLGARLSPYWRAEQIIKWYGEWKGLIE